MDSYPNFISILYLISITLFPCYPCTLLLSVPTSNTLIPEFSGKLSRNKCLHFWAESTLGDKLVTFCSCIRILTQLVNEVLKNKTKQTTTTKNSKTESNITNEISSGNIWGSVLFWFFFFLNLVGALCLLIFHYRSFHRRLHIFLFFVEKGSESCPEMQGFLQCKVSGK